MKRTTTNMIIGTKMEVQYTIDVSQNGRALWFSLVERYSSRCSLSLLPSYSNYIFFLSFLLFATLFRDPCTNIIDYLGHMVDVGHLFLHSGLAVR